MAGSWDYDFEGPTSALNRPKTGARQAAVPRKVPGAMDLPSGRLLRDSPSGARTHFREPNGLLLVFADARSAKREAARISSRRR